MCAGVDGLLRDKTRPSRIPLLLTETAEWVVALTLAEAVGVSSVRRIRRARAAAAPHAALRALG